MILGIDIGGTTIKVGLIKNDKIEKKYAIDTNAETMIDDMINSFKENDINLDEVHAIGCAIPGFIDHKAGIVTLSGNLGLKDYHFKDEFEKALGKSVYVVNDANAAALGEYWVGAGADFDSTILYTLGTGLGGGIVINNELVFGKSGFAGELGHGGNFQNEVRCTCGLMGCIEPISSATGITRALEKELGHKTTVKENTQLFIDGDEKVVKAFRHALTPLATHIAVLETALNPDAIIIGGGPSNIGEPLAKFIEKLVEEHQLDFIAESTPILIATTKNDAGILGAAYWALTNKAKEKQA